jgi:hypothetical protein
MYRTIRVSHKKGHITTILVHLVKLLSFVEINKQLKETDIQAVVYRTINVFYSCIVDIYEG